MIKLISAIVILPAIIAGLTLYHTPTSPINPIDSSYVPQDYGKVNQSIKNLEELLVKNGKVTAEEIAPTVSMPEKETVYIDTPFTFIGMDNFAWDTIVYALYNLRNVNFVFNVQGVGGDLFELNKVLNAMYFASQHGTDISVRVVGPSYSAHAFFVCGATQASIEPTGSLMFHSPAQYKTLLGLSFYRDAAINEVQLENMRDKIYQLCIAKEILTPEAVGALIMDQEVIVLPNKNSTELVAIVQEDRMGFGQAIVDAAKNAGILITLLACYLILIYVVISVARSAWRK